MKVKGQIYREGTYTKIKGSEFLDFWPIISNLTQHVLPPLSKFLASKLYSLPSTFDQNYLSRLLVFNTIYWSIMNHDLWPKVVLQKEQPPSNIKSLGIKRFDVQCQSLASGAIKSFELFPGNKMLVKWGGRQ